MTTLIEARDSYVAALQTSDVLSSLGVTVSTHPGVFDAEQIARYSKAAPAVVVALIAFGADVEEGYLRADTRWAVMVLAEDRGGRPKAELAMVITAEVVDVLLTQFVNLDVEHKPQQLAATNRFDVGQDRQRLALWSVDFGAQFQLSSSDVSDDTTEDLTGIDSVWDVYPRDNNAPLGEVPEAIDNLTFTG